MTELFKVSRCSYYDAKKGDDRADAIKKENSSVGTKNKNIRGVGDKIDLLSASKRKSDVARGRAYSRVGLVGEARCSARCG